MGRAARGPDGCTCHTWTKEAIGAAEEVGATARAPEELVDWLVADGWLYRVACEVARVRRGVKRPRHTRPPRHPQRVR